jgi:V/A-type H+/Na+-transporting ATPase subunit D
MSRVKASKHELKVQREALKRFERYLPTLRLKQQQLQVELRRVEIAVEEASAEEARTRHELGAWIELWSEPQPLADHLALAELRIGETSVAGVSLPTLEALAWRRTAPSPRHTPPWVDDALIVLESLLASRLRRRILAEQRSLLAAELRLTSQRVNLFEKVRIPAAQEALRVIRIALGDLQAAEVVRAKIAKAKSVEQERAA